MLEPIQLLIKINHAVQSNKDLHQKTDVLASANSKSFDQILSLFNFLKAPLADGISEKATVPNGVDIEEMNSENPNNLTEADWLELDVILQELFGLYQQMMPIAQPPGQAETLTSSISQPEITVSQSVRQVIGDVRAELAQWLEKAGGIERFSPTDKNQLIERITQYASDFTPFGKITQNVPIELNLHQSESKEASLVIGKEATVTNSQASQSNSRLTIEQSNILEQIIRLFGLTEQNEITKSPASNIRDGTTRIDLNPLLVRTVSHSPYEFQLERKFINTTVQVNRQTSQPMLSTERYNTVEPLAGNVINDSIQEPIAIGANPLINESPELAKVISVAEESITPRTVELIQDTRMEAEFTDISQEEPIEILEVARKTEIETLTAQQPVKQPKISPSDNMNTQEVVEQVLTQTIETNQDSQKQAVETVTTGRAQVFVDASPPDKRKTTEGIPRQDNSEAVQQTGINAPPLTTETVRNLVNTAQDRAAIVSISDSQVNHANRTDNVHTTFRFENQPIQVPLAQSEPTVTIGKATPEHASNTERIPTTDEQPKDGNSNQQQEMAPVRTSGISETGNTAQAAPAQTVSTSSISQPANTAQAVSTHATLTLSSFVPDVSEWMGRFFKITHDKTGTSEAKFSMYPEHLGHLEIKIAAQKGHITAQILTDTQATKEALESQLTVLKQALQQQGLQVQKIEIIQHTPTAPELNQGNNPSFSQGGSHQQQQFNQSNEELGYTASKTASNTTETEDGAMPIEKEKSMPAYTYGGKQIRTTSRIDFSA